jgi:hypothetical protein
MTVVRAGSAAVGTSRRSVFERARTEGALWYVPRADGERVVFYRRALDDTTGLARAVGLEQRGFGTWVLKPWEPDPAAPPLSALVPLPDSGATA